MHSYAQKFVSFSFYPGHQKETGWRNGLFAEGVESPGPFYLGCIQRPEERGDQACDQTRLVAESQGSDYSPGPQ